MKVERVVVDSNVLISYAIKPDGLAGQVADWIVANSQLVLSRETYAEFETRLWRSKFDRYITIDTRKWVLNDVAQSAVWVEITGDVKHSCDSDDDKFIETALVAGAPVLVSGDSDLLDVQLDALAILTPRQFAEQYIDADAYRIHDTQGTYTVQTEVAL